MRSSWTSASLTTPYPVEIYELSALVELIPFDRIGLHRGSVDVFLAAAEGCGSSEHGQ